MHFLQRILFSLIGYTLIFWVLDNHYNTLIENIASGSFNITGGVIAYLALAILLGFINSIIKPILMIVATPLRWLTLGLFSIVINAFLLWLLQILVVFVPVTMSLEITHWQTYIIIGIIISFINGVIHWFER